MVSFRDRYGAVILRLWKGNNRCSYCTIPKIRGPLRSRPIGEIIEEAQLLVSQGAKELCLVGQDIAAYGIEGDGKPHLTELLKTSIKNSHRIHGLAFISSSSSHRRKDYGSHSFL